MFSSNENTVKRLSVRREKWNWQKLNGTEKHSEQKTTMHLASVEAVLFPPSNDDVHSTELRLLAFPQEYFHRVFWGRERGGGV